MSPPRAKLSKNMLMLLVAAATSVAGAASPVVRSPVAGAASPLVPSRLTCESIVDPLGVDIPHPRLSWIVTSPELGQRQIAYRIIVATSPNQGGRGDLWDTGKVRSPETRDITYHGKSLRSAQRVYWRVQVWDKDGKSGSKSGWATWTMALLKPTDWRARWIGAVDRPRPRKGIGYHALEAKSLNEVKWVQIDLGRQVPIDRVVLHPVRDHLGYQFFGFPPRFRVEFSDDPEFRTATLLHDQTTDFEATDAVWLPVHAQARYIRVTATKLYRRKDGVGCFALAELEVDSGGKDVALGARVTALDSVERDGWTAPALTDGSGMGNRLPVTLLLRKEATIPKPVSRALAYVTGLGQYEMSINGRKVGDDWITPGWTEYRKTILVDTYDVTNLIQLGRNAFALHIGNGMYDMSTDSRGAQQQNSLGTHRALCQIMLQHPDGSTTVIGTDKTWTWHEGPETYSGEFGGEDWDERLVQKGWKEPGFAGKGWKRALEVAPPKARLCGITHAAPPLRMIETRGPVAVTIPKPNLMVLDLGQNAPYVPKITVHGPPGTTISFWPAEMLKADGTIYQQTMRSGKHASYTLAGIGDETWHPLFWYCGSRYWQVQATDSQGRPLDPKSVLKDFTGLMVHSSARPVGTFECSNRLFNQIHDLIRWAIRSNLASVISDCPHREKSGWLEEDHLMGPGLMYSYDLTALFRKVVDDMRDTQLPNGMVPTMAPEYFFYQGGFRDSVEWGGAYLFVPQLMREWYGDRSVIRQNYSGMKRYVDYLSSRAKDGILSTGLGDWNGYGNDPRTPVAITDTCYYFKAVADLADFAVELKNAGDAKRYQKLAQEIRAAFQKTFFDRSTGKVGSGSQSAQATALDLGLIDDGDRQKAFGQLLQDVADHDFSVSCGEVGHPSLLRMLAAFGRSDIVAKIHLQTERPGYGYQIKKGMTTLTEAWDASPISLNHFMLGHLMEWLYADLAGINPDPAHPGYANVIIRPRPVPQVQWAKATYDSVRGEIESSWRISDSRFELDVAIPANCTASVWIPGGDVQVWDQGTGKRLKLSARRSGEWTVLSVPSGRFRFRASFLSWSTKGTKGNEIRIASKRG